LLNVIDGWLMRWKERHGIVYKWLNVEGERQATVQGHPQINVWFLKMLLLPQGKRLKIELQFC
jgi:hypothetical protein